MLQERIRQKENIQLVTCAVPTEIVGEKRAEKLVLSQKGTTVSFDVDGVFVAIGSVPNTSPVEQLCTLDASGYILAGESGVTEVPGFFAAGDVRTKSLRQVVTAVADGAVCVQSVEQYFNEIMVIQ
jgi:thioredoxin reductase (NADPH)